MENIRIHIVLLLLGITLLGLGIYMTYFDQPKQDYEGTLVYMDVMERG